MHVYVHTGPAPAVLVKNILPNLVERSSALTRFELLAVDIDGTLVGPDQQVSARNVAALQAAKCAGLTVCLCTGRCYAEARHALLECELPGRPDPIICAGGAVVRESDTARTLHLEPIDHHALIAGSEVLGKLGLTAIALVDGWRWPFDYAIVEGPDAQAVRDAWLNRERSVIRTTDRFAEMPDLPEVLRLSAVADGPLAEIAIANLHECCDGKLAVGHLFAPNLGVHLLECHGAQASKWTGIRYVAQGLRIRRENIAAVGDDTNDLPMLTRAGLGVAMGNAAEPIRQAADHVAGRHDEDGLGEFVEQLLDGAFDGNGASASA